MYLETLRAIDGIEIFPIISLLLFVLVFSVMLIRTAALDRRHLLELSHLPFSDVTVTSPVPDAGVDRQEDARGR